MLREDTGKMKLFWTHMGTFSFFNLKSIFNLSPGNFGVRKGDMP